MYIYIVTKWLKNLPLPPEDSPWVKQAVKGLNSAT